MPVTDGWNSSLITGHADIDRQHRDIFSTIDALLEALRHGYADQEVKKTLQSLETYVGEHFSLEENLMKQKGYPELAEHKSVHEAFSVRLGELKKVLQQTGTSKALALQTVQAVGTLLRNDIETYDRKLARFLNPQAKAT